MGLVVSSAFTAAEKADVSLVSNKVYLVLGNYANASGYGATAISSGDDASGNYPAAGAIDGDRTEINVGAASGADNGTGKSSWRSSGTPDGTGNVWLQIDLGASRTFNRVKLYHLNGHGLKTYFLQYYDAVNDAWITFAGTTTTGNAVLGYGEAPFGTDPYGDPATVGPTAIATTGQLDTVDLVGDVTARYIRCVVYATADAGVANIVELEVYRKVDISDRVLGIEIDRQQDYKLKNNLATTCNLELSNTDRFFSTKYTPTAAETTAGFVNSELRPGMGLIVQLGFYGVTVALFTGSVDTVATSSRARTATIAARDGIKGLINNVVSTKLKTSADIGTNIQYLLNLANISNYEMSVDTTTIVLDYFFTYATSILTTIQQLAQACGDANFRFDEKGVATFKMHLNSVAQSHTDTSQSDFDAATLKQNIDDASTPGQFQASFSASGAGTVQIQTTPNNLATITGGGSVVATSTIDRPYGTWQAKITPTSGTQSWWFISRTTVPNSHYRLDITSTQLTLVKHTTAGADTTLLTVARAPGAGDIYKVTRDGTGLFTVYVNSVSQGTATDNTYTDLATQMKISSTGTCTFEDIYSLDSSGLNQFYPFSSYFDSQVIDMTANVNQLGTLSADYTAPSGSSISWYTATSSDGTTWDAWVAASVGVAMASAVKRYIKYRAVLNIPLSVNGGTTPVIYDVTANWYTGSGSSKYPANVSYTFRYDGSLIDVDEESTDDLGGDTAILNDIQVQSTPLLLSGADTDTQWQGTANVPAAKISTTNKLAVTPGTYTYYPVIPSGMDTSRMSGANPAAVAITFADSAVGSWVVSNIHPTTPTVVITVTVGGTISDFRMVGKAFSSSQTPILAQASDAASIALYDKRNYPLSNNYLINSGIAQSVANRLLANFKAPTTYIKTARVQPTWSIQVGDRCTIVDDNSGVANDFIAAEVRQVLRNSGGSAQAYTELKLMLIV